MKVLTPKNLWIFGIIWLIALIIITVLVLSPNENCTLTQLQLVNGRGALKVSFDVKESLIDSLRAEKLSYETPCASGTLEENASWSEDVCSKQQVWNLQKNTGGYSIAGTIADCNGNFYECESPSTITFEVSLYRRDEVSHIILKTYPQKVQRSSQ